MKYREYKIVAKKHVDACNSIIANYGSNPIPESVLRELHYLSGYIVEGVCVYAIYKHYQWEEDRDIQDYDPIFTGETGLDYYKNGKRSNGYGGIINTGARYYINSHGFFQYVELLDVPFHGTNIPYIDPQSDISDLVYDMIDKWRPDLRYRYGNQDHYTKEDIVELIKTCSVIFNQINRAI